MTSREKLNKNKYSNKKVKENTNEKKTKEVKKVKKIKRRIRWKNLFLFLFSVVVLFFVGYFALNIKITNIYIEGNRILNDQEVIEMAGVENYPGILDILRETKKNLKQNILIKEAEIDLDFRKLTIKIEENYPLFYNANNNKTVLVDGSLTEQKLSAPLLINYVPDTIYDSFVKAMRKVNLDIIERISEIKYDPDTVDDSRFLLSMRDGNYVYLTITKWDSINSYVSIIKEFPGKKGIIYLNAGNSFEVFE